MSKIFRVYDQNMAYVNIITAESIDEAANKMLRLLSVRCARYFDEDYPYTTSFDLTDNSGNRFQYQCTFNFVRDFNSRTGWSTSSKLDRIV
ncbi:putative ORFan [Tupanvirus deep ocean]|uniref:ORFan n=2 Tax=Tupanvirus TaxID=2094720 RepID=A0AC62A7H3_9VIRU|nr:putative ORFan [Tupanvirus deep ocean]QKU33664.1 putative ORFan [Tupanvirus deep ocean]